MQWRFEHFMNLSNFPEYNSEYDKFYNEYEKFTSKNKISPAEANALRHLAGSMYFTSIYGANIANGLGTLNELNIGNTGSQAGDLRTDLYNNIGRLEGIKYNNLTPEQAILKGINLIKTTNKAALRNDDARASKFLYPVTPIQKIIATLKD